MTPITIFRVSELLTILPFQFGFHPQRCLVVASLADGLVAAMRLEQESLLSLPVGTATSLMLAQAQRSRADRIVLIDYETGCSAETLAEIATACERAGCGVPHVLHVRAQTWWASRCVRGCCDGTLPPSPPRGMFQPPPSSSCVVSYRPRTGRRLSQGCANVALMSSGTWAVPSGTWRGIRRWRWRSGSTCAHFPATT